MPKGNLAKLEGNLDMPKGSLARLKGNLDMLRGSLANSERKRGPLDGKAEIADYK
jgi:hypothetical protein